jgi:Rv2525c-like, glycoside hydrolase-like domain
MIIDTNSNCTRQASFLVQRGVEAVGRYYAASRGSKVITKAEARVLSASGVKIFAVYEDVGSASQFNLTADQGGNDARRAKSQASAIGQPKGGVIYFAVEGLPGGYKSADLPGIKNYFSGITNALGNDYTAGVYGDGIVCRTPLDEGICRHTWLAQASWAFEGTIDFYASKRWSLAQIVTDLPTKPWRGLSVDINEGIGDIGSFLVPTA